MAGPKAGNLDRTGAVEAALDGADLFGAGRRGDNRNLRS
jgi:hypothetical protein